MKVNCPLSYDENGKLEVLVSAGYGAGWSTWNTGGINLAVDKRIIDFFKANSNADGHLKSNVTDSKLSKFMKSIGYIIADFITAGSQRSHPERLSKSTSMMARNRSKFLKKTVGLPYRRGSDERFL